MGIELIIIGAIFLVFVVWALFSKRLTRGRTGSVTKEPVTLRTEPGYRPDQAGPIYDSAATTTTQTQTKPTDSNAHNMP